MVAGVSDCFDAHRSVHTARNPDLKRQQYEDELHQIGTNEGLFELSLPPATSVRFGEAPTSRTDEARTNETKYLWVVAIDSVPAALEYPANGTSLKRGKLAHTNLTGGSNSHTAGELWYYDEDKIVINGGSSRYTPRSSEELCSVERSFEAAGYKVANMGWDDETNRPMRVLLEKPEWT